MSQQSHNNSGALQFLEDVLRVIRENDGDAKVVEPLLDANTDRLNDNFPDILRRWLTSRFSSAQLDEAKSIATDIIYFGIRIREFPRGSKLSNVEIAIACYETVLNFYTRQAFPYEWAMTQNNLGIAYWNRIKGEKRENLEQAIAAYQEALKVRTRQAFPYDWARTQMNLGIAYRNRIKGEKRENLEQAISAYREALEVYTREAFPSDWARTQMNLGIAYWDRIKGEKRAPINYDKVGQTWTKYPQFFGVE